jgi:hypothetical protein
LAQDGGEVANLLERSGNDYWLRAFICRRAEQPVSVLMLNGDRRRTGLYKLFPTELGGIYYLYEKLASGVGPAV